MKLAVSLFLSVFLLLPAAAQQVPAFSGDFQTTNPTSSGNSVQVTFAYRLVNGTGTAITGATAAIVDSTSPARYGATSNIAIAAGGNVVITQVVTVPQRIANSWQANNAATVQVQYVDANGNPANAIAVLQASSQL